MKPTMIRDMLLERLDYDAISECALRDGPEDYIVRQISDEMGRLLMGELRMKFGRSRR